MDETPAEVREVPETILEMRHNITPRDPSGEHPEWAEGYRRVNDEATFARADDEPDVCVTLMLPNGRPTQCECGRFIFKPRRGWTTAPGTKEWRAP